MFLLHFTITLEFCNHIIVQEIYIIPPREYNFKYGTFNNISCHYVSLSFPVISHCLAFVHQSHYLQLSLFCPLHQGDGLRIGFSGFSLSEKKQERKKRRKKGGGGGKEKKEEKRKQNMKKFIHIILTK